MPENRIDHGELISLTADIVAAYVGSNSVVIADPDVTSLKIESYGVWPHCVESASHSSPALLLFEKLMKDPVHLSESGIPKSR